MLELLGPALAWGSADRQGTVNRAPSAMAAVGCGQCLGPMEASWLPSEWLAVLVRQTGLCVCDTCVASGEGAVALSHGTEAFPARLELLQGQLLAVKSIK